MADLICTCGWRGATWNEAKAHITWNTCPAVLHEVEVLSEPTDITPLASPERVRELEVEVERLREAMTVARHVADHWRRGALDWGDERLVGRAMAHPLCLVLAALDGERDPAQLGVGEGPDADAIRAASPSTATGRDDKR